MNQLIPLHTDPSLVEAALQDEHARRMQAYAHEVAGRPGSFLDPSDFLEMARQARCNAATLREMTRRR